VYPVEVAQAAVRDMYKRYVVTPYIVLRRNGSTTSSLVRYTGGLSSRLRQAIRQPSLLFRLARMPSTSPPAASSPRGSTVIADVAHGSRAGRIRSNSDRLGSRVPNARLGRCTIKSWSSGVTFDHSWRGMATCSSRCWPMAGSTSSSRWKSV